MKIYQVKLVFAILWMLLFPVPGLSQEIPPQMDGWIGLDSTTGHGWLAIKLDFPETMALTGVAWYNNDENVVFPKVYVAAGMEFGPGDLMNAMVVHGPVSGISQGLSEVEFDLPVAASLGGLYVVFEFPEGSQFTGLGIGGGAAFGCLEAEPGVSGWISGDSESWLMLDNDQHFAVEPLLVAREEGMAVKSFWEEVPEDDAELERVQVAFLKYGPNPFNPRTKIQFGIPRDDRVTVEVFDIRGARVKTLVNETLPKGRHSVYWNGEDKSGHRMSSGTYLVRMKTSEVTLTKRVLLIK